METNDIIKVLSDEYNKLWERSEKEPMTSGYFRGCHETLNTIAANYGYKLKCFNGRWYYGI